MEMHSACDIQRIVVVLRRRTSRAIRCSIADSPYPNDAAPWRGILGDYTSFKDTNGAHAQ
jgi:hypothetical protein